MDAVQVESEGRGGRLDKPNLLQVQGVDRSNLFSSWFIMEIEQVNAEEGSELQKKMWSRLNWMADMGNLEDSPPVRVSG